MTVGFMGAALVWQPPQQQAQARMESESSSTSCVDNQPCHTSVWNSSTPESSPTLTPQSSKPNHNHIHSSTTTTRPALNSTENLAKDYPSIANELADLLDDTTN